MPLQTSYFARFKEIVAADLTPVAISIGIPRWFRGLREPRLAPTRAMLKMSPEDYDRLFDAILAPLDPAEVLASLPANAVLLCWERPFDWCHRRRVAEWLETLPGVVVTEFGFDRGDVPAYREMAAR